MNDQAVSTEKVVAENDEFRVGEVLSKSISTLMKNVVPMGTTAIIFYSPLLIFELFFLYQLSVSDVDRDKIESIYMASNIILWIFLTFLITAALAYGTLQELRGNRVSTGDCLRRGLATVFPVLGVAFLESLGIILGTVAFVLPGVILMAMWWVAIPVAVIERPGIIESLKRSAALTKGHRWGIFGLVFLLNTLDKIVGKVTDNLYEIATTLSEVLAITVLLFLVSTVLAAVSAVTAAVGYYHLRAEKEGIGVDDIVSVFD